MKYTLRFFSETDHELVPIDAVDSDDRQDQIDAAWDENGRGEKFDGVEWWYGHKPCD